MSVDTIISLFVTFILPLISVGVIKKILKAAYTYLTGQATKLPYALKLTLGLVFGIGFAIFAQTGFDPRLIPYVNPILTIVIALASNKLYDLLNDLRRKKE